MNSDSSRFVLGAVAAAGICVTIYVIGKKIARRSQDNDPSSKRQPKQDEAPGYPAVKQNPALMQDRQKLSVRKKLEDNTNAYWDASLRPMSGSMYADSYGGHHQTNTTNTVSVSGERDRRANVSQSPSQWHGPRSSANADNYKPSLSRQESESNVPPSHPDSAKEINLPVQDLLQDEPFDTPGREKTDKLMDGEKKEIFYESDDSLVRCMKNVDLSSSETEYFTSECDGSSALLQDVGGGGEALAAPVRASADLEASLTLGDYCSDIGAGDAVADISELSKADIGFLPSFPANETTTERTKADAVPVIDMDAVTQAIMSSQATPESMTEKDICALVSILQQPNPSLLLTALGCISKCATFSCNQRFLREAGCPAQLLRLIREHGVGAQDKVTTSEALLISTCCAIVNMAMDLNNQAEMEGCLQLLVDLILSNRLADKVQLSALQVLTNLSLTSNYHSHYTRSVQQLYKLLESENQAVQLQALKVLVNLSCNPDMLGHLLAAEAPKNLLDMLEKDDDSGLPLRLVTLLANITSAVQENKVSHSSLPTYDKAASPETLYSSLYGVDGRTSLRSKVYRLTNHTDSDVAYHAKRLYVNLPSS